MVGNNSTLLFKTHWYSGCPFHLFSIVFPQTGLICLTKWWVGDKTQIQQLEINSEPSSASSVNQFQDSIINKPIPRE